MKNLTPAIGWDLDSTLCDTSHRQPFIEQVLDGHGTFEDYSMMCPDDTPVEGAVALMNLLAGASNDLWHVAISGRSSCALDLTWDWCWKHNVHLDYIRLRPDGDSTPNGQWKVSQIRALREERGIEIVLFVEDHGPAARYIRQHAGIPVLGVNPFYDVPSSDPSRSV